jgi:DUF3014 family protein
MKSKDSFWMLGAGVAVLLVGAGAAVYYYQRERAPEPVPDVAAAPPPVAPEPIASAPVVQPQPTRTIPLPPLDKSDAEVRGGLTEIFGRDAVGQYLAPERIVRNIVVTIDNLPREKMALQQRPIKPTPGKFLTAGPEDGTTIAPDNSARYAPLIEAMNSTDAQTLVALYRGLQPLFQEAYEDLGHPNAVFNTRLIEVIDHLLQTPDVPGPIRLVQPSVYYRYADPRIEALSSGQKLLIRMGPENAGVLKAKLREIREELF